jgi:hypothetical protein
MKCMYELGCCDDLVAIRYVCYCDVSTLIIEVMRSESPQERPQIQGWGDDHQGHLPNLSYNTHVKIKNI